MIYALPYIVVIIMLAFYWCEGLKDTFLWIEINKASPVKYTNKKMMHKLLALSRGLVFLLVLIVLAYVYEFRIAVLFTLGLWLQHFLIHAGTYYHMVNDVIPGAYPFGFFTNGQTVITIHGLIKTSNSNASFTADSFFLLLVHYL